MAALFQRCHVGEDQLGVDNLDVADRVDRAEFVNDVVVFKAAHHLHDRVGFADIGEELVAQARAFRRAFHQAGDVDKLDRRWDQFLRARDLRKHREPRIRHADDADVRVDRTKWVIGCLRLAGAGYSIEECRFTDIG